MFGANQGAFAAIKGLLTDGANNTTGAVVISTRPVTTDSTLAEAMRIAGTGLVGIGVSPSYKLDVSSSAEIVARFARSGGSNALISIQDPTTTTAPYIASYGNSLAFGSYGGSEYGRFLSSGNFGIGTNSPGTRLQVRGPMTNLDTTVYAQMLVQATDDYNASPRAGIAFSVKYNSAAAYTAGGCSIQSFKENSTDGDFGTGLLFTTQANGLAPSDKMRLDSGGKLLLGVTTGSGLSNNDFAMVNGGSIRFRNAANSAYISAFYFTPSNGLDIGTGGSLSTITFGISGIGEAARFDTSANLLVGTTTSAGLASNPYKIVGGIHNTASASALSFTNGTATTIFTISNYQGSQSWIVCADVSGQSNQAYACVYIVTVNYSGSAAATQLVKGALASISVSGLNVQYTQSSGGTQNSVQWSAVRIM
jgi:hypothetical protein